MIKKSQFVFTLSPRERTKKTINMGHGPSSHEVVELCNPNNMSSAEVQFVIKAIRTLKMKKYYGWGGRCMGRWQEIACNEIAIALEMVMSELRKNQNFHFDLQIHPTLLNSTYLHCQMTGFIPIRVQNFQNVE